MLEREARERAEALETRAADLMAEAERQVSCMLAEARQEVLDSQRAAENNALARAEELRATAYEQGYQDGVAQGLEEGRRQAMLTITAASKIMIDAQQMVKQSMMQVESQIVELAVAVARRIIAQELITSPETAVAMAHQMLAKLHDIPHAVLRVASEILPLYRERLEAAKTELREIVTLEIMGDPLLSSGDFLIDTPSGTVDGRLDAQLDVLRKVLLKLSRERVGHHE